MGVQPHNTPFALGARKGDRHMAPYNTTLESANIGCHVPLETCTAPKTMTSAGSIPSLPPILHLG
jgi:hypothetical protein